MDTDKDLLEVNREDFVGGLSIVFTRRVVVDETSVPKSTIVCKSLVGIDANQICPYSICQPMPTGFDTRWDLHAQTSIFTLQQKQDP